MKIIFIFASVFILSGCATIFSPSHDPVTFTSTPEGAVVFVDGSRIGRTPTTVQIKRQLNPPRVEVKSDGHHPAPVVMQNTFNSVSILNVFFWPGFIIDAATGSIMKASQFNYDVELEPQAGYSPQPKMIIPSVKQENSGANSHTSDQMWGGKQ